MRKSTSANTSEYKEKEDERQVKIILNSLMTMEYVRIRKSTMKDIEALLEQRKKADWHILAAIVGAVVVVAIAGLVLVL